MIKNLKLKRFKLFKDLEFSFDKINIIKGVNLDDIESSSNGSGKSSILEGIILGYYGEGSGKNLQDLISFGEKSTEITINTDDFKIIRKIPTELNIYQDKEIQFNTNTLKQNWINEKIGSYDFFKKYRLINKQAINLLDLGIISLRKELMNFVDDLFTGIRKNLLAKKLERETYNVNKRLYKFYLSEKRLDILNKGLDELKEDYSRFEKDKDTQQGIINQLKSEISSREKMIYNHKKTIEDTKNSGICPILKTKCLQITKQLTPEHLKTMNEFIERLYQEIEQYKKQLESESESILYYNDILKKIEYKERKTREYLLKLKEAFKFKDYHYTQLDVKLYESAIKVLDEFAGWYIQNWLDNLTLIINDLLSKVNLLISFSADKQFMTITNENQTMKYEQLSSGQQCFLNCIFKIAILLNNGTTDGLLLFDEGINVLDEVNLKKLINILKILNFQTFLIYQNYDLEEENINLIEIERKNNQSYKK